ncbi:hypothetical protein PSPO01_05556 [Paraphaeosphaeria sporulosa]
MTEESIYRRTTQSSLSVHGVAGSELVEFRQKSQVPLRRGMGWLQVDIAMPAGRRSVGCRPACSVLRPLAAGARIARRLKDAGQLKIRWRCSVGRGWQAAVAASSGGCQVGARGSVAPSRNEMRQGRPASRWALVLADSTHGACGPNSHGSARQETHHSSAGGILAASRPWRAQRAAEAMLRIAASEDRYWLGDGTLAVLFGAQTAHSLLPRNTLAAHTATSRHLFVVPAALTPAQAPQLYFCAIEKRRPEFPVQRAWPGLGRPFGTTPQGTAASDSLFWRPPCSSSFGETLSARPGRAARRCARLSRSSPFLTTALPTHHLSSPLDNPRPDRITALVAVLCARLPPSQPPSPLDIASPSPYEPLPTTALGLTLSSKRCNSVSSCSRPPVLRRSFIANCALPAPYRTHRIGSQPVNQEQPANRPLHCARRYPDQATSTYGITHCVEAFVPAPLRIDSPTCVSPLLRSHCSRPLP